MEDAEIRIEYHRFISSGLLALYSASSKPANSVGLSNIFLGKWVELALKRHTYKKSISSNVRAMLGVHKSKGRQSGLFEVFKLHYEENLTHGLFFEEFEGTDEQRLKDVSKLLNQQSWVVHAPLDYTPEKEGTYEPKAKKELFSLSEDWSRSVSDLGKIEIPLRYYSTEVLQEAVDAFYEHGFYVVLRKKSQTDRRYDEDRWYYCFDVYPYTKPINGMEIPTVNKLF